MANMTAFNTYQSEVAVEEASKIVAAAAELEIDMSGVKAAILRVANGSSAADAYVTIGAGDGIKKSQGARIVKVEKGNTAYIPIYDTARHLKLDDKEIVVQLNDGDGDALTTALSDIDIEAIVF